MDPQNIAALGRAPGRAVPASVPPGLLDCAGNRLPGRLPLWTKAGRRNARPDPSGSQAPVEQAEGGAMPWWKRATDVALAGLVLPGLALVTLAMAVVVRIVSPGPVFFRQERIGYRGRRFMIYKFRTMFAGAESAGHRAHCEQFVGSNAPMAKLDARGDSRLIPGGRLIRATGLDELPQIINVLRGEMSLIGPRPCVPYEYDLYLPRQRARFGAVPGLSGLWQVSGKNRTTFEEMIRLDLQYIRHRSWRLDLRIMLLTPVAILQQIQEARVRRHAALGGTSLAVKPRS